MSDIKKIWIDTDPAFGDKNGDCDDGYCMLALLHSKVIDVLGISAVYGNTDVDNAYSKLDYLKTHFYPDLNIYKGSNEPLALNNHKKEAATISTSTNKAVEAMANALENLEKHESMTIVAIGSMVNIAALLLLHKNLIEKIESVIVVAGRFGIDQQFKFGTNSGNVFRDLNFDVDPSAFNVLLNAPVKTVLAGVEVAKTMWIYDTDLSTFKSEGESDIQYMAESSSGWLKLWESFGNEIDHPEQAIHGFNPFDLFAGGFAINEDWFVGDYRMASTPVALDDTQSESNVFKPYLIAPQNSIKTQAKTDAEQSDLAKQAGVVFYLSSVTDNYKKEMMDLLLKTENKS